MVIRFSKIVICLFLLAGLAGGCEDPSDGFDIVPHLEWRGSELITVGNPQDNRRNMILKLYFNDRDGDIGTQPASNPDTCDQESYNLFIRYFEKTGSSYTEILPRDTCQPFHNILPYLTPEGQNKVLEGEINATFSFFAFPKNAGVDSVKFEVQLRDRANHYSNIVSSPAIFIPQ